jgi:integrase
MARERGDGGLQKFGNNYYMTYYLNGRQIREKTGTPHKSVAREMLKVRMAELGKGLNPVEAQKLTYENMRAMLISDYQMSGNRSLREFTYDGVKTTTILQLNHLDKFFKGWKAVDINTAAIRQFIKTRQDAQAKGTTINRSTVLLGRMFNLAKEENRIQNIPHIPKFSEKENAREGFVDEAQFEKITEKLPADLHPLFMFLYHCAVRFGEAIQIRWSDVDLKGEVIRLRSTTTKNKSGRTIPITDTVLVMLKKQFKVGEFVFASTNYKKAWARATKEAGFPDLLIHDLRRSGIRNLIRAGVSQDVAMKISGHKTASVFSRYNITSTEDIMDAKQKLQKKQILNKTNNSDIS